MGDQRASRISDTLRSLFESLIPHPLSDEEDEFIDQRIDSVIEDAKEIVHAGAGTLPADINQAQDLIKRKLLRANASPEKAARFSNLYSRLLSIPVLSQKWSILYLLYRLSEDQSGAQQIRSPLAELNRLDNSQYRDEVAERRESKQVTDEGQAGGQAGANGSRSHQSGDTNLPTRNRGRKPKLEIQKAQDEPEPEQNDLRSKPENALVDAPVRPTEADLLRDLPFNLQGLSSAHFKFVSTGSVRLPSTLPVPLLSLLHALAEPCLLYKSLSDFTQGTDGGLVTQSLRAAISDELRSYLSLVATLEGEIRRALTAMEREDEKQGVRKAGVTLKRCVIWTRDATMGLRLMSLMVEES